MLRVVTYHRVAEAEHTPLLDPSMISATPTDFRRQIEFVRQYYDVVSLQDVLDFLGHGRRLPKRPVLLTFDDAYRDFATVVWPILKQHRLPATLFVPTAYASDPDSAFWWDRLYRALFFGGALGSLQERLR